MRLLQNKLKRFGNTCTSTNSEVRVPMRRTCAGPEPRNMSTPPLRLRSRMKDWKSSSSVRKRTSARSESERFENRRLARTVHNVLSAFLSVEFKPPSVRNCFSRSQNSRRRSWGRGPPRGSSASRSPRSVLVAISRVLSRWVGCARRFGDASRSVV